MMLSLSQQSIKQFILNEMLEAPGPVLTFSKQPWFGTLQPKSLASSLYMFCKLGGMRTPGGTLKERPMASPANMCRQPLDTVV